MRPRRASIAALVVTALASASGWAQEAPLEVARRDLIAQAEAAAAASDHALAVRLAERAREIRVTPTLQYFLAREHLALDHPVEALDYSGSCARAAEADLALRNREAVLEACRELVAQAQPRVGRVTVRVASPCPEGLTVRVREAELSASLYDVAVPMTPGAALVEARAPGFLAFRSEVLITAGQTASVDVRLDPTPVAVPIVAPIVAPPRAVQTPHVTPRPRDRSVGPWIVGGAGAAALVLGGVFFGLSAGARGDRDAACEGGCLPDALNDDRRYVNFLMATNASLLVGAVALAGGATWFLVSRATQHDAQRAGLSAGLAPTAGGLSLGLRGRF